MNEFSYTKQEYIEKCERIITSSYSECGHLKGFGGAAFSKIEALAMLLLLRGATSCRASVHYHSGHNDSIDSLMIWGNNLVVEFDDPKGAMDSYDILRQGVGVGAGSRGGNRIVIPCVARTDTVEKFKDLIVAFNSYKPDYDRINKEVF